jgi:ABC-2 type transport system ATP-binding protein
MRILTSFISASSGTVFIDGEELSRHTLAIRRKIGYLPETPPLYTGMTVRAYLKFAAEIKDVPVKALRARVDQVLEECQLVEAQTKIIGTLSKGYRQRVGIAQAIIHAPKILILDEPTSGLDPIQILQVRALIKGLRHERTVLLSTHILPEIEEVAQRVLVIRRGEIVLDAPLATLLEAPGTTLEEVFLRCHAGPQEQLHA